MKILAIILGVLLAIGGFYCMFAPVATYEALIWLFAVGMIVDGVARIVVWNEQRKAGTASGWTLAGGIITIILGIFLLGSFLAQVALGVFFAYLIAVGMVVGGITRIIAAFQIRNAGPFAGQSSWVAILVLGLLTTCLGVWFVINPGAVVITTGFLMGLSIIFSGIALVVAGIQS